MKRVLLGHISSAHGLKGEVLVKTYTAEPEAVAAYGALTDEQGRMPLSLEVVRVVANGVVARIDGIGDRTAAEKLKGRKLWVERNRLPPPDDEEFYYEDLIGLAAVAPDGTALGTVVAIQNFGAGDLLEIEPASARGTVLVVFTRVNVPVIDFALGRVTVVLPASEAATEDGSPAQ